MTKPEQLNFNQSNQGLLTSDADNGHYHMVRLGSPKISLLDCIAKGLVQASAKTMLEESLLTYIHFYDQKYPSHLKRL